MRYLRNVFLVVAFLSPSVTFAQSSACVTFDHDLAYGDTGSDVTTLQTFLTREGYFNATPVPNFGNATLAAVRAFQSANGISATGTVGPLTRAAIQSKSCGASSSPTSGSSTAATTPTNTSSNAFEISGWIPYWRSATGTADVLPHLSEITEVNPFVYTLKSDGSIVDNGALNTEPWVSFLAAARTQKVRVVPTIMSGNGDLLHVLLSNMSSRIALEDRITALVKQNGFDGIDIDFEGKKAATKNYFSTFLKGLYQRMGTKWVMCTIESRTPIDSRYYGTDIPSDASIYSNDFVAINKYCDRVRIMAYDQQGIDQQLASAAASSSQIYAPVADPQWVKKVVAVAEKDIKKSKIMLGVPTYGYEYDVTAYANNQYNYDILWTFNPGYALPLAAQYGVTPQRNSAGELEFTYTPNTSSNTTPPVSLGQNSALLAATAASTYATTYNSHLDFRLLDWPDAISIAGKAELAQSLGLRGISIFKWDGGEDPQMWSVLRGVKQ